MEKRDAVGGQRPTGRRMVMGMIHLALYIVSCFIVGITALLCLAAVMAVLRGILKFLDKTSRVAGHPYRSSAPASVHSQPRPPQTIDSHHAQVIRDRERYLELNAPAPPTAPAATPAPARRWWQRWISSPRVGDSGRADRRVSPRC